MISKLNIGHIEVIRELNEAVDKFLTVDFLDYVFVVVIAKRPAELVVVHIRLVFPQSPETSNFL